MNLDKQLIDQVRQIFASLLHTYTIHVSCDTASEHGKETVSFYTDFSSASDRIGVEVTASNSAWNE